MVELRLRLGGMIQTGLHAALALLVFGAASVWAVESREAAAPVFESAPSATSNPTAPNAAVNFSTLASGTEPLTYVWNFGDGTNGSGDSTSHSYAAAGTYIAAVMVTDANGLTASASVNVVVTSGSADDDQDGFSNNVEANLQSDLESSASRPFNLPAITGPVVPFKLQTARVTLTFVHANQDQIVVTGVLPISSISSNFNPSQQFVIVDAGNVVRAFQLDASGNAINSITPALLPLSPNDSFQLRPGQKSRRFKFTLGFGSFQSQFTSNADPQFNLANTPGPAQAKKVRVTIYINNTAYQMTLTRRYRVIRGVGKFGQ